MARIYRRPDQPGGTYYIDFNRAGKRIRKSLETTVLKIAKQRRDAILAEKVSLKWGAATVDIEPDEFWKRYTEWAGVHNAAATTETYGYHWRVFVDYVKPRVLGSVSPQDVERFIRYRKQQGRAPMTINDSLTCLKGLYNRAVEMGVYSGENPFSKVKRLRIEKTPPKYLTQEQIAAVMKAARGHSEPIHLFCALGIYAGLRTKEIGFARWEWIDFEQGTVTVQGDDEGAFTTKGKRHRTVPLHEMLRAILELVREPQGYIINPIKVENGAWRVRYEPRKAFATVCKEAGVPWATPHTLRHTFASQLVMSGVSLYKVQRWLGHSDPKTAMIYAHLAPTDSDIYRF